MTQDEKLQAMHDELHARDGESDKDWVDDLYEHMFEDNSQ